MDEHTHDGQPTDETGQPLTDAEIAAVIRARPLSIMVIAASPDDDVLIEPAGIRVTYRSAGGSGQVVVTRSVVARAVEAGA